MNSTLTSITVRLSLSIINKLPILVKTASSSYSHHDSSDPTFPHVVTLHRQNVPLNPHPVVRLQRPSTAGDECTSSTSSTRLNNLQLHYSPHQWRTPNITTIPKPQIALLQLTVTSKVLHCKRLPQLALFILRFGNTDSLSNWIPTLEYTSAHHYYHLVPRCDH